MNVFTPPAEVIQVLEIMRKMGMADINQIILRTGMSSYKIIFILCLLEEFGAVSLEESSL